MRSPPVGNTVVAAMAALLLMACGGPEAASNLVRPTTAPQPTATAAPPSPTPTPISTATPVSEPAASLDAPDPDHPSLDELRRLMPRAPGDPGVHIGPSFAEGPLVAQTEHIDFHLLRNSISEAQAKEYAPLVEAALVKIALTFGVEPPTGMKVQFGPPAPLTSDSPSYCPPRGVAMPGRPYYASLVLADDETPRVQVLAVAAHELGHQLTFVRFGSMGPLNEGVATWLAQEYVVAWLGWPSLDEAVRTFVATGTYIPFDQRADLAPWAGLTAEECWARRDTLYGQYGSFVGFLIEEYGIEALARLWESVPLPPGTAILAPGVFVSVVLPTPPATPTPGPGPEPSGPDYKGVYGRSLDELEREWLGHLGTHDE